MDARDTALALTQEALRELDDPHHRLSGVVRKAIRVARLREDYDNLWWLLLETVSTREPERGRGIGVELQTRYSREDYIKIGQPIVKAYVAERSMREVDINGQLQDKSQGFHGSITDAEHEIERIDALEAASRGTASTAQGNFRVASLFITQKSEIRAMLARVATRVHDFLSRTEHQLLSGQLTSDVFQRNLQYVDASLSTISPDALHQLQVAYQRVTETDEESWSHALTSCRRAMKSLADALYPATGLAVLGADGKQRVMSDDAYKNRLWQLISEKLGGHVAGELLLASIVDLGNRLDKLYELSSKGVHTKLDHGEAVQCVLQLYTLTGDILRVASNDSAIGNGPNTV